MEDYTKGGSVANAATTWNDSDNHQGGGNCYFINGSAKFVKLDVPINRGYDDNVEFPAYQGAIGASGTNGTAPSPLFP